MTTPLPERDSAVPHLEAVAEKLLDSLGKMCPCQSLPLITVHERFEQAVAKVVAEATPLPGSHPDDVGVAIRTTRSSTDDMVELVEALAMRSTRILATAIATYAGNPQDPRAARLVVEITKLWSLAVLLERMTDTLSQTQYMHALLATPPAGCFEGSDPGIPTFLRAAPADSTAH